LSNQVNLHLPIFGTLIQVKNKCVYLEQRRLFLVTC